MNFYSLVEDKTNEIKRDLALHEKTYQDYRLATALQSYFPNFIGILVISLICYFGLNYFHTPGTILFSFFYIFVRMVQSMVAGLGGLSGILFNHSAAERVYSNFSKAYELKQQNLEIQKKIVKNIFPDGSKIQIQFENVSFIYQNQSEAVFKNFNLIINDDDDLLIMGSSGSGKSTLILLLLGLLEPTSGRILINKIPVANVKGELHNVISYVGPDPFLIPGTVAQNLIYGHANAGKVTEEDMIQALKMANIYNEIQLLPGQLQYFLHEHAKLSTGQKQRISIARAFLRKSKLFIFDECTANLDSESEKVIINNMKNYILKNATSVIISHRPSFQAITDKQINLESGNHFNES